jgi:hypothetical protein
MMSLETYPNLENHNTALFYTANGGGKMVACKGDFVVFMRSRLGLFEDKMDKMKEDILLSGLWNLAKVSLHIKALCHVHICMGKSEIWLLLTSYQISKIL